MELEKWRKEIYGCQRCGWCKASTYLDQGIEKICPVREYYSDGFWEHFFSRGKMAIARGVLENRFPLTDDLAEAIYMCSTCGNCEVHCSRNYAYYTLKFIDHKNNRNVEIIEALRALLVEKGYGPMKNQLLLTQSVEVNGNPWQQPKTTRTRWTRKLKIKDLNKEKARYLYFVGCTFAYDNNINFVPPKAVGLLNAANVDFGILGTQEKCCGSILKRTGSKKLFVKLAKENIEQLNSLGIEALITNCAGCYKTIRNDYPEVGKLNFKVMHVTELYEQLIQEGKLKFKKEIAKRVTYHDPCHLGKHSDFYDPPRNVLKSIPGIDLVEMYPTREHGFCCGGGGGLASGFRDLATKVGVAKLKKALETGADILSSACPFCYQNFLVALGNMEAKITFKDVTELLADSVIGS